MNGRNEQLAGRMWLGRISLAVVVMLLSEAALWACPNCRDAMASDPAQAGLVRGFFWSIVFMLSMPFLTLAGISAYFYWEVRRARRAIAASPFASDLDVPASLEADVGSAEEYEAVGVG